MNSKEKIMQQHYEAKTKLLDIINNAKQTFDSSQELFEDYFQEEIKAFHEISSKLFGLEQSIRADIPLRCICGSFKFEEKRIVTLINVPQEYLFCEREKYKLGDYKYFCVRCGVEVIQGVVNERF